MSQKRTKSGFTLIELSIVLVIIGLIVGGVLVGQSLISAATVRAQITQIEKFNTAAETFYGKYGYLPGDIKDPEASNFGFAARGVFAGEGDGNGVIDGVYGNNPNAHFPVTEGAGETVMFWKDLAQAHLIAGNFVANSTQPSGSDISGNGLSGYFPEAKMGNGNFIYVYGGGVCCTSNVWNDSGINYYGLSAVRTLLNSAYGYLDTAPGITVQQAYSIDKKMDDGLPQLGRVTAQMSVFGEQVSPSFIGASDTSATIGSSATCYDNGGNAGTQQSYSLAQNGGLNVTCALSFQFQ